MIFFQLSKGVLSLSLSLLPFSHSLSRKRGNFSNSIHGIHILDLWVSEVPKRVDPESEILLMPKLRAVSEVGIFHVSTDVD